MTDNEFLLVDRISAINATDEKWDLQKNGYISFSGGKDSTILHYLFDEALPGNRIPRVFIDTGIEYAMIREFVLEMASHDDRFQIIKPTKPIKQILETYGYPFKSKEHSMRVDQFNKGHNSNYISKYIGGYSYGGKKSRFTCPSCLLYQFEEKGKYNFSNLCCAKLKKQPVKQWERANGRRIAITGMRAEEGGNRARLGCAIFKGGKLIHFHPLIKVSDDWEDWFVRERERYIYVHSIQRHTTSSGQDAKAVRSLSIFSSNSPRCSYTFRTSGSNANSYGSMSMTNTGALDTASINSSN